MSGASAARRAALEVLRAVRRGDLADRALVPVLERLPARERPLAQELVYGTLRLRTRLDHALAGQSSRPLSQVQPDVLDALRLGAYQLLELSGVPAYAAVSESVELVKEGHANAGGFTNAVLNALLRNATSLQYPELERDPLEYLATWGSQPRWLAERWLARYGVAGAAALAEANNQRPELFLRLLSADAGERLRAHGIAHEWHPLAQNVVRLEGGTDVAAVLAVAPAIVQDPAAALVVQYAAVGGDAVVADLCAAPGGKAVGLASGARVVVAADLSLGRMRRVRENRDRVVGQGAHAPLALMVADGRAPAVRPCDVVLLDAPCTGTGTLRRHPDGRWRVQPKDLAALATLQCELLDAAHQVVKPGGLLVYSTCSLEPEENEAQVERFLTDYPEYRLEPAAGAVPDDVLDGGLLRVLPHQHGTDGAFAARLRRRHAR